MQAIILAAGMGKRLKTLTADNTKCMVQVNGVTLIERMLKQLEQKKLSRIIIVIGYEKQKLIDYISSLKIETPIKYVDNPIYDRTNNIYSLSLAKQYLLEEDTLLLESDLIFEDSVLDTLIEDPRDTLALVDKYESWMDGTVIKIGEKDSIEAFIPGKNFVFEDIPHYFKTVNIYKFSKFFSTNYYVPFLTAYEKALGENEYYEQVLRVITLLDEPVIWAKRLDGQRWYEIDDIQDLDIAESIFHPEKEQRVKKLQKRYGGYWRYPKLLDFCYLVNPYYPPQHLLDEIKANFNMLITSYPSGMEVNSLLAAKNFSIRQDQILVGNGAAELIKTYLESYKEKVGIIRPTFEEYANRLEEKQCIIFEAQESNGWRYDIADLISFYQSNAVKLIILINPDNPTGNFIEKQDLLQLASWSKDQGITLLVDESFVDFSDKDNETLIETKTLDRFPNLLVVKSISKSYGVPGLRLGILASGDIQLIARLKKRVAIWNINSFAEYYMQICGKYEKSYSIAIERFRNARKQMLKGLEEIPGITVYPTQANYVLCRLPEGYSAAEITQKMLLKAQILIKDLTSKLHAQGQYIRLAIRREEENEKALKALSQILQE